VDNYRPLYAHLQANRHPGDTVYVSFLANSSAIYYGPRYGLRPGEYSLGVCERDDTRAYVRDLDRFRGRSRVWVVSRNGPAMAVAREAIHRYLNTIGVLRDSKAVH